MLAVSHATPRPGVTGQARRKRLQGWWARPHNGVQSRPGCVACLLVATPIDTVPADTPCLSLARVGFQPNGVLGRFGACDVSDACLMQSR